MAEHEQGRLRQVRGTRRRRLAAMAIAAIATLSLASSGVAEAASTGHAQTKSAWTSGTSSRHGSHPLEPVTGCGITLTEVPGAHAPKHVLPGELIPIGPVGPVGPVPGPFPLTTTGLPH